MVRLGIRLLILSAVIGAIALVPMPVGNEILAIRDAVMTTTVVFGIGKILYDTLFYDHFRL
jgi:hypothetical protein